MSETQDIKAKAMESFHQALSQMPREERQFLLGTLLGGAVKPGNQNLHRNFADVRQEHMAWGKAQGGVNDFPWSRDHARCKEARLLFWEATLGFVTLEDAVGCLPSVEAELRKMLNAGRAGKTVQSYAEALASLFDWCVKRDYMPENPLKRLSRVNTRPRDVRRALTIKQLQHLLSSMQRTAQGRRRWPCYVTAILSGLRRSELRALRVKHLDVSRRCLILDAAWTKNRQDSVHRIPVKLVEVLQEQAEGKSPEDPLLYVPGDTARSIKVDLRNAGIPFRTHEGKVDFHALRVAYVSGLAVELKQDIKTVQRLARHGNVDLTLRIYAKSGEAREAAAVEDLGNALLTSSRHALKSRRKNKTRTKEAA